MKFAVALVLAVSVLVVEFAFAASPVYQIPHRDSKRGFQLLRQGRMAVEIGYEESTLFYSFKVNRIQELPDVSTASYGVFERPSKNEFYYFAEERNAATDEVTQTLVGFSLGTYVPRQVFQLETYKGGRYGQPSYSVALSPDESKLYLWSMYGETLEVVDLDQPGKATVLKIPNLANEMISDFRFIKFNGQDVLAIVTNAGYQQSKVVFLDVESKKAVLAVSGYDFGRRDANSETEPFNINASIDPQGDKGMFCDHDACVLVELSTKKILKTLALGDGNNSGMLFSEDGKFVFTCEAVSERLSVLNAADGAELSSVHADICSFDEQTLAEDSTVLRNHAQVLTISPEGKIVDQVSVRGLNAYDDMTVSETKDGIATVITVDWEGKVLRHKLGLR